MQTVNYNTVIRLAENIQKITEEEFQLLEKINNIDSWNGLDDLERLVNDYINKDIKIIKTPLRNYVDMALRNSFDNWLDESEQNEIIESVFSKLNSFDDIQEFTDYENNKDYTLIYNNFDVTNLY